jgi:GNAT superfamily N-acetyltransferase
VDLVEFGGGIGVKRILVGVDASRESVVAANYAADLAQATGASLILACAVFAPDPLADPEALADATRVVLRPLRPGDAGRLATAFARLSQRTRALRFLGGKSELSPDELRKLSDVDGEMHFAIVACLENAPDEMIGIVRFLRFEQDPARAEVAATVVDAFQGQGLGRLLLLRLTEAARERGVRAFYCELAERNSPGLGLVHEAGLWPERGEDGVVAVEVPLPAAP